MMTEPTWRKSSYSGEGNCLELSDQAGRVLVRDTQDRQGPVLTVSARAWREFVGQVQER
jgi:Domain of unknown function (DUF397)